MVADLATGFSWCAVVIVVALATHLFVLSSLDMYRFGRRILVVKNQVCCRFGDVFFVVSNND